MQIRCVDAAREAARLAARGDDGTAGARAIAPDGAAVQVRRDGEHVVATVTSDPRCCRGLRSRGRPWPLWSRVSADRGSATLVAVAMVAVLLAITVACVYLGSAVTARHRAQAAADLAALAAAGRLAQGADAACAHAVAVAVAMQATVADCALDGSTSLSPSASPQRWVDWERRGASRRAGGPVE